MVPNMSTASLLPSKVCHQSVQNLWEVEVTVWTSSGSIDRTFRASSSRRVEMKSIGRWLAIEAIESLESLALFKDSCVGSSMTVGLLCPSLAALMEVAIIFSPVGTSKRGSGLTIDLPSSIAENLCFVLGTSSILFFPLSLMRGCPSLSWPIVFLLLLSTWSLTCFATTEDGLQPLPLNSEVVASMEAMSRVECFIFSKFSATQDLMLENGLGNMNRHALTNRGLFL